MRWPTGRVPGRICCCSFDRAVASRSQTRTSDREFWLKRFVTPRLRQQRNTLEAKTIPLATSGGRHRFPPDLFRDQKGIIRHRASHRECGPHLFLIVLQTAYFCSIWIRCSSRFLERYSKGVICEDRRWPRQGTVAIQTPSSLITSLVCSDDD